jgi:hypothetical protein
MAGAWWAQQQVLCACIHLRKRMSADCCACVVVCMPAHVHLAQQQLCVHVWIHEQLRGCLSIDYCACVWVCSGVHMEQLECLRLACGAPLFVFAAHACALGGRSSSCACMCAVVRCLFAALLCGGVRYLCASAAAVCSHDLHGCFSSASASGMHARVQWAQQQLCVHVGVHVQ